MPGPEELARIEIDTLLALCNWVVQDKRSVIVEDLEAALAQFAEIAADLSGESTEVEK